MAKDVIDRSDSCIDAEELQLLLDRELESARQAAVHGHAARCTACAERLRGLQALDRFFRLQLGREDDVSADDALTAVARVEAAIRNRPRRTAGRVRRWVQRLVPVAGVAAAGLGGWLLVPTEVTAAPGVILDMASVRERAWTFQPGKVLHWVVESDISGSPALPDDHYRTLHWVSNVKGAEGSAMRRFDSRGELVTAAWTMADGSGLTYRPGATPALVQHLSTAALREQMETLEPVDRQRVGGFLLQTRPDEDLAARRNRFADWLLDSAAARSGAILRSVTTDTGRSAYYIRREAVPPAGRDQVRRLTTETYIEADGYRRYRLRTTRERHDGTVHFEDARWTVFAEVSPKEFEAQNLTRLTTTIQPLVMDAARIARRESGRK